MYVNSYIIIKDLPTILFYLQKINRKELNDMLEELQVEGAKVGLHMNYPKTQFITNTPDDPMKAQ